MAQGRGCHPAQLIVANLGGTIQGGMMRRLVKRYGEPRLALALFADSARRRGAEPPTLWHMGLCHAALGDADAAERCFAEATDNGFIPDPPASPR